MNIKTGKKMLWLTSWPHGKLIPVHIIGKNTSMGKGSWYIGKPNRGTDTTTTDFLFDYPDNF